MNFDEILHESENLAVTGAILAIIGMVSGFLKTNLFEIFSAKKSKYGKLQDHISYFNKYDKEFINKFLLDYYKQCVFKDLTGIDIDASKQDIIIELHKNLNEEFSWTTIKKATVFMSFKENNIEIKINKFQCINHIFLFISSLYFIGITLICSSVMLFYKSFDLTLFLTSFFSLVFFLLFFRKAYFFYDITRLKKRISLLK